MGNFVKSWLQENLENVKRVGGPAKNQADCSTVDESVVKSKADMDGVIFGAVSQPPAPWVTDAPSHWTVVEDEVVGGEDELDPGRPHCTGRPR